MAQILRGQNLRILEGSSIVYESTNCTVTINGETEDSSTKDTTGMFSAVQTVRKSWSAEYTTLNMDTPPQSTGNFGNNIRSLLNRIIAAQAAPLIISKTTGANNSQPATASYNRSGSAFLTDLSFQFNNRVICQATVQYTGNGPLA